jgi:hypothetical protein
VAAVEAVAVNKRLVAQYLRAAAAAAQVLLILHLPHLNLGQLKHILLPHQLMVGVGPLQITQVAVMDQVEIIRLLPSAQALTH